MKLLKDESFIFMVLVLIPLVIFGGMVINDIQDTKTRLNKLEAVCHERKTDSQ